MSYIDREQMLKFIEETNSQDDWMVNQYNADYIYSFIETRPTEDVAPIKHGKWEYDNSYDVCSLCGFVNGFDEEFTYCPGCGAKMDLGGEGR